jgi:hypothetical protein
MSEYCVIDIPENPVDPVTDLDISTELDKPT